MKEIEAPKVATIKCNFVNSNWTSKLWLAYKKHYSLDYSENFTTQTRRESANFPTSFTKFEHSMQKLQPFELDLKLCEDTFGPLGR